MCTDSPHPLSAGTLVVRRHLDEQRINWTDAWVFSRLPHNSHAIDSARQCPSFLSSVSSLRRDRLCSHLSSRSSFCPAHVPAELSVSVRFQFSSPTVEAQVSHGNESCCLETCCIFGNEIGVSYVTSSILGLVPLVTPYL